MRTWPFPVAVAIVVAACGGSSSPSGPRDPLTIQIAQKCHVKLGDVTHYDGDMGGFAGANYKWTLASGAELLIYSRMNFVGYRLLCANHRNYPLPSFDPSSLPQD